MWVFFHVVLITITCNLTYCTQSFMSATWRHRSSGEVDTERPWLEWPSRRRTCYKLPLTTKPVKRNACVKQSTGDRMSLHPIARKPNVLYHIKNSPPFTLRLTVPNFDVLLTVHLNIFISVINQLDAQNFCFTIRLFHACTCFEHMCWKHVEAWNKTYCETNFVHQVG